MAIYSTTWAKWVQAELAVRSEGLIVKGRENQNQKIADKAADRLYRLGGEFGLNPSSRTKLSAAPKDESDPFLDWLSASSN